LVGQECEINKENFEERKAIQFFLVANYQISEILHSHVYIESPHDWIVGSLGRIIPYFTYRKVQNTRRVAKVKLPILI
jgi:hypothetical protein